jgi:hypothetical protein
MKLISPLGWSHFTFLGLSKMTTRQAWSKKYVYKHPPKQDMILRILNYQQCSLTRINEFNGKQWQHVI